MANLLHSPADVVSRLLPALGVGTLPSASGDWPVHCDLEPATPDEVITVYDTAGRPAGRAQPTGETLEVFGILIRLRSRTFPVGYAKAQEVTAALDAQYQDDVVISGITYYVHAVNRAGSINRLGKEVATSKRSLFTVNALVTLVMR